MSATSLNQPRPAPRRKYRIGGFRISSDVAARWASQLAGEELHPIRSSPTIKDIIFEKTLRVGANFRQVGEVAGVDWMLITQGEKFEGYKGMDSAEIPQFEPGEKDKLAQELLDNAGIKEYEFATVLD